MNCSLGIGATETSQSIRQHELTATRSSPDAYILSGDFFFFLDAVGLNKSEGLHLMQIGKRIRQLHELLPDADNLGSFLLLHLILQDQQSFELALNSAPSISDIHAVQLLDDVLDSRQETGSLFNSAQIGFHYFEMKYPKYT